MERLEKVCFMKSVPSTRLSTLSVLSLLFTIWDQDYSRTGRLEPVRFSVLTESILFQLLVVALRNLVFVSLDGAEGDAHTDGCRSLAGGKVPEFQILSATVEKSANALGHRDTPIVLTYRGFGRSSGFPEIIHCGNFRTASNLM